MTSQPEKTQEEKDKEEEENLRFIYGHPTINGKETIYSGKKFKKKNQRDDDNYDLRSTHTVLSNILQMQMEKNKKQLDTMNLRKYYSFDDDKNDNDIELADNDNNNSFRKNNMNYNSHAYSDHRSVQKIQRVEFAKNIRPSENLGDIMNKIDNLDTKSMPKENINNRITIKNSLNNNNNNINNTNLNALNDAIDEIMEEKKETTDNNINNEMITTSNNDDGDNIITTTVNPNPPEKIEEKKENDPTSPLSELEKEAERANREYTDKEKEKENQKNARIANKQKQEKKRKEREAKKEKKTYLKKKRGRPQTNFTYTLNDFFDTEVKKNLINSANMSIISDSLDSEKIIPPPKKPYPVKEKKPKTPKKYKKNKVNTYDSYGSYGDYIPNIFADPLDDTNENSDMNLLEILFKEYGYNNIIYVLTDSPEIKIGENKIKKIRNGLNGLLGCETNIAKIIETIVNMRKANLIDENWIKGKYNYKTRNRNNFNLTSYHYHLSSDGYIYKFKAEKNLHDGGIKFKCCDPKCNGRAVLYQRIKCFKTVEKHNLAPLQHIYMKKGYDNFQYKMENHFWKEVSLKNNPDDKKRYIDWHKTLFAEREEAEEEEEE